MFVLFIEHRIHFIGYVAADTDGKSCVDASGNIIQLTDSLINDNYCDCTGDGADEYLTSACSFVVGSKFKCENKNDKSEYIYSSRVNDGVWIFSYYEIDLRLL